MLLKTVQELPIILRIKLKLLIWAMKPPGIWPLLSLTPRLIHLTPSPSELQLPWFPCCSTHTPSCSCLRDFVLAVPFTWEVSPNPSKIHVAYFEYQRALS